MSHNKEVATLQLNLTHATGVQSGAERAMNVLQEGAAAAHKAHQDDTARILRDYADRIQAHVNEAHRNAEKWRKELAALEEKER